MEEAMKARLAELLPEDALTKWHELTGFVEKYYDTDILQNKGFGDWEIEYKYRRGGKTLCTFYAKEGKAELLIIYGKAEREKLENIKVSLSKPIQDIYDNTTSYHDGKWLWIPLEEITSEEELLEMLKIKRRPNRK